MTRITETSVWQALIAHRDNTQSRTIAELFAAEPRRFGALSRRHDGLLLDLSKNRIDEATLARLLDLADTAGVAKARDQMFAGEAINTSEDRPVLHVALRDRAKLAGGAKTQDVNAARTRMADFVAAVRGGQETGATDQAFTDVVSLAIGGSHLGPLLAATALAKGPGPRVHFVANVDGTDLSAVLNGLDPATTLFLVGSKSFTTQETMTNAKTARAWVQAGLGADAVPRHFAAMTAAPDVAAEFGISQARVFPFWDWVGGRFSLWSAVGLPAALAMGWDGFDEMSAGAHAMDGHFKTAPLADNLPVLLALAGIWNNNFENLAAHAVVPYDERLRHLPALVQQLEMESNGKSVDLDGQPVATPTAPAVFGMTGTNAQHSFHQWLHQGLRNAAVDFIAAARPGHDLDGHHDKLIANMLAQAEALAFGTDGGGDPHKACPGNRPSTTILIERLDARRLGMLIALYEHKVFVQGVIWGINSFDQFGVELGKQLAARLLPDLAATETPATYDSSTAGLIGAYRAWRDGDP